MLSIDEAFTKFKGRLELTDIEQQDGEFQRSLHDGGSVEGGGALVVEVMAGIVTPTPKAMDSPAEPAV